MRYLIDLIQEAPIDNLEVVGDLVPTGRGSTTKSGLVRHQGSFTTADRDILTRDKSVEKIRNAFEKTPFVFDFYIFITGEYAASTNLPWTKDKLEAALGRSVSTEGKITVCYSNNVTGQYVPMTAWILAHRMSHHFHINGAVMSIGEHAVWKAICDIALHGGDHMVPTGSVLGPTSRGSLAVQWAQRLYTMRSARQKTLKNNLDVFGEALAQYLLTGRVKLNRAATLNPDLDEDAPYYPMKIKDPAAFDQAVAQGEAEINAAMKETLQALVGTIIGW